MEVDLDLQYVVDTAKAAKKNRKPNFSHSETLTLLEEVGKEKFKIVNQKHDSTSNVMKREIWNRICFKTNAMFGTNRAPADLKKKWKDCKNLVLNGKMKNTTDLDAQIHKQIWAILKGLKSSPSKGAADNKTQSASSYSPPYVVLSREDVSNAENCQRSGETQEGEVEDVGGGEDDADISDSDAVQAAQIADAISIADVPDMPDGTQLSVVVVDPSAGSSPVYSTPQRYCPSHSVSAAKQHTSRDIKPVPGYSHTNTNNNGNLESLQTRKLRMKIKWLESEIAKNDSIVELNREKAEYVRAKRAKLEI